MNRYDLLVVLGPTASGKTRLGVCLARMLDGEIISVDSRQVYRGLNLASGKDLDEYSNLNPPVPYHLIDIADVGAEYNLFAFLRDFHAAVADIRGRGRLPVAVGGTGLYLDALLRGYRLTEVPENSPLRQELAGLSMEALRERLLRVRPNLHNTTDLNDRDRCIRAIEIAEFERIHAPERQEPLRALVVGIRLDRAVLKKRIAARLRERLEAGMVEEIEAVHAAGVSWERLEQLGLECRFVAQYLQGKIRNRNDLFQKLASAIYQFARRQESWFRRMEREGIVIHWTSGADPETLQWALQELGG
ncbi:MAG TPA: tRNA (adenosine(37)-N6)-dimethylallyltransferase MiaA [Candidatus Hydrogenedentes bacterium]|nr:tRNA (adenosine(37)-N6)-dimethylallyltransferase MiaA [Candidatus Hydrogenedentota bacterium]HPU96448.1 tRNA (adenosine(37)-N6)-dimethylallyltransferase MiaA [Candidatus Hydrogenedentota bacterium]